MQVLVLCDDHWHPAVTARTGLGMLEGRGFEFDWIEHAEAWSAERMFRYSLVILTKSNNVSATDRTPWVTDAVEEAFLAYVRQGNGLLAIHSGTAEYKNRPVLRALLGGIFVRHPAQCPVTVEPRAEHPITMGSSSFTLVDEHYFMTLDDAEVDLFMTSTSEHGTKPAGWSRIEGEGRVCVLTPGHNVEVWLNQAYQSVIYNALRWCGKLL